MMLQSLLISFFLKIMILMALMSTVASQGICTRNGECPPHQDCIILVETFAKHLPLRLGAVSNTKIEQEEYFDKTKVLYRKYSVVGGGATGIMVDMGTRQFILINGVYVPLVKNYVPNVKPQSGDELLHVGDMFKDRYHIKGMIGKGGYGQIYYAEDTREKAICAIKTERKKKDKAASNSSKRMFLEQKVLYRLQGRPHTPIMVASGHTENINFMVMHLLGPNVGDLRKKSPVRRLSATTVARVITQGVAALRDVHNLGYLHRDIKPANMCFGITQNTRHVLKLVDYGLVRRYKNPDGTWREHRVPARFRGTLRYVSPDVHDKFDQCPADDLTSMAYSGAELLLGDLPWKFCHNRDLREAKLIFESSEILDCCGQAYSSFSKAVFSLKRTDNPDYSSLQALLIEMQGDKMLYDPYDWEEGYKEAIEQPL